MEEQGREQARLVSNTEVIKELVHLCGERSAKLLLYQLKTRYGIDISEDEPPCSLQTLYRALSETLGSSLAASITCKLYPETRRATCIRRIES